MSHGLARWSISGTRIPVFRGSARIVNDRKLLGQFSTGDDRSSCSEAYAAATSDGITGEKKHGFPGSFSARCHGKPPRTTFTFSWFRRIARFETQRAFQDRKTVADENEFLIDETHQGRGWGGNEASRRGGDDLNPTFRYSSRKPKRANCAPSNQRSYSYLARLEVVAAILIETHARRHRARSNSRAFASNSSVRIAPNWLNLGPEYFFVVVTQEVASPRRQTIVQIPPYFMITHVQTALRKAGNYDKTGRARKNTERARLFVYTTTADRCSRQVGGGGTRAGHGVARASPLLGHRLRVEENIHSRENPITAGRDLSNQLSVLVGKVKGFLRCFCHYENYTQVKSIPVGLPGWVVQTREVAYVQVL
ncbi:hypothetical protein K0M31_004295 [Melipona bicolor]|uniref:Uncharacterized protein n=1 Tax=Melipona bicolor TaxID=60889 RepID=A0AA40FWT2_9HYME|nr:hypothetical protein K0M31_004295 [Melipona bicolor]